VQNLFTAPEGYHVAIPSVDPHGRRLAFSIREESHEFTRTGKIYSVMHENYFHRPRSLVVAIDPEDGAPSVAWGEHEWISHVVVHPTEPNRIVFCHEGGLMVDHRLWVVDTDVLHKRTARPLYEEGPREFLVHEFFLPDGTLCVQHTVFAEDDAGRGDWSRAEERVMFLDDAGQVLDDYRLPGERDMHVQSTADRSLLVGDSWFPDPDTPHEQGSRYMALHRPDGDRLTVEKLCRHDTSWRTQTSHPHPVFGPDDQCVVFNSDAGGHSSACVCEV
jgi:oligogalacturonide lyase